MQQPDNPSTAIQQTEKPPILESLHGLRFAFTLPVFLIHAAIQGVFTDTDASWAFLNAMGSTGHAAVSCFFVLSGFVITWSSRPADTPRTFYRRRVARVWPNHLVVLAIVIALALWAGSEVGVIQTITQALLLQAWVPDPSFYQTGNTVSWSLSADVAFYALFPLLLVLIRRIDPARLWFWAALPLVGIIAIPTLALLVLPAEPETPLWQMSELQYFVVYFFPLTRILECVLGMLMARIVLTGQWIKLRPLPAAGLVLVAYLVSTTLPFIFRLTAVTVLPIALLVASLAASDVAKVRHPLNSKLAVRLGDLTFAFYLIHGVVLDYGHMLFGRTWVDGEWEYATFSLPAGIALIALAFVVSLALAWVLFTLVERPAMRRWSRSRAPRKVLPRPA